MMKWWFQGWPVFIKRGGPGSGNWGHAGRPGKHGGSAPGGGLSAIGAKPDSTPGERRKLADEKQQGAQRHTEWLKSQPEAVQQWWKKWGKRANATEEPQAAIEAAKAGDYVALGLFPEKTLRRAYSDLSLKDDPAAQVLGDALWGPAGIGF